MALNGFVERSIRSKNIEAVFWNGFIKDGAPLRGFGTPEVGIILGQADLMETITGKLLRR
jgi:hypothetical protein